MGIYTSAHRAPQEFNGISCINGILFWNWRLYSINASRLYVNAVHLHKEGVRPGWAKCANRHEGRKQFQINTALALKEHRIRLDWTDVSDESTKPEWMRQADCMPCNCGVCFFCKEGKTSGINHEHQKTRTEKKSQWKKVKKSVPQIEWLWKAPANAPCATTNAAESILMNQQMSREKGLGAPEKVARDAMHGCARIVGMNLSTMRSKTMVIK